MQKITKTFQYGEHTVTLETGQIARQAGGAVKVSMGDTVVLVTAVGRKEADPGRPFFRLLRKPAAFDCDQSRLRHLLHHDRAFALVDIRSASAFAYPNLTVQEYRKLSRAKIDQDFSIR